MLKGTGLCCAMVLLCPAIAAGDVVLKNGANVTMTSSPGSRIVFPDGSHIGSMDDVPIPAGHGGSNNTVTGTNAFIGGGSNNTAEGGHAVIGGGASNYTGSVGSTVSGGVSNSAPGNYTSVKGHATIGGGSDNTVTGGGGTVAGGTSNFASGTYTTVGGGFDNTAGLDWTTVSGGKNNVAGGYGANVSGGAQNTADANYSAVGGGKANVAVGLVATIAGGRLNEASGAYATIPGGYNNTASGNYSFAAGRDAVASHANSFVWGDSGGGSSANSNTFNVHASGGIYLNGVVEHSSDRTLKTDFVAIDPEAILDRVADMPIASWRFTAEAGDVRHVGPTAQDFAASLGLGNDDKYIAATDADGVALAAIQGLNAKLERRIDELEARLAELEAATDSP